MKRKALSERAPKNIAKSGKLACPFTVLYWNFLDRNKAELAANPRTALMAKSVGRLAPQERTRVRAEAQALLGAIESL